MCGIAGMIDLSGQRAAPPGVVPRDGRGHRPPRPGRGRLPRTARPSPRQSPALHRRPRRRPAADRQRGPHRLGRLQRRALRLPREARPSSKRRATASAPTATPNSSRTCWEDHREKMFDHLRGQFAVCLWDERTNEVVLARDRFGICPLFCTAVKHDGRLAAVRLGDQGAARLRPGRAQPDLPRHQPRLHLLRPARPGDLFEGVTCLPPGHYLRVQLGDTDAAPRRQRAEDLLGDRLPRPRPGGLRRRREARRRRVRSGAVEAVQAPAAGRRAGRVVPLRRRRFEPRRRDGEQGARPADPDVHHLA